MAESSSVLLFDTQRAVEDLVATGVPPEQAAVIVKLQSHWAERDFATGEDIERLRTDVGGDVERLRAEVGGDIERLRTDLTGDIERLRADVAKDMAHLRTDVAKDIAHLRANLELKIEAQGTAFGKDLDALRGALEARITETANTTIKWVTGAQVGTAAVFLAALLWALKL